MQVVVRYSADTHLVSWAGVNRIGYHHWGEPLGEPPRQTTGANHWGEHILPAQLPTQPLIDKS
jgi:hypothetical protein